MATTLPRPHSADFSSLGLSPALSPARARPKSQTFRSSPLAGPALSLTELATEKGKGSTTPPRVTVTLAELGAVRTTKGSVAFPHKHPEARRHSSVSFASTSSLRPPRVPFASESAASQPRTRPQSILAPEQHWLTVGQAPVFSRSSLYTQNIVMPVRAPRSRRSTSSSSSTQIGTTSGDDSSSSTSASSGTPSRQSSSTSLSSSVRSGKTPGSGSSDALSFTPRRREKSAEGVEAEVNPNPAFPTPASPEDVDNPGPVRRRTLSQRLTILVRSKSLSRSKSVKSTKSVPELQLAQADATVPAPFEFLKHDPAALQHAPPPPPSPPAARASSDPPPPPPPPPRSPSLKKRFSLKLTRSSTLTPTPAIRVSPAPGGVSTDGDVDQHSGDAVSSNSKRTTDDAPAQPRSRSRRRTVLGISRSFMSDLHLLPGTATKTRDGPSVPGVAVHAQAVPMAPPPPEAAAAAASPKEPTLALKKSSRSFSLRIPGKLRRPPKKPSAKDVS